MLCFIALKVGSAKGNVDEICTVRGSCTTIMRTVRNMFNNFCAGNFDLKYEDYSDRLATTDTDLNKSTLAESP